MTPQHNSLGAGCNAGVRRWPAFLLLPAALAPLALHWSLVGGGVAPALVLAAVQCVLVVCALRHAPLRLRLGVAVGFGAALGALAWTGASAIQGLLWLSGASHAVIFGGLLATFAWSLLPPGDDVVTVMARRLDPGWTPAMAGYTRAVAWVWAGFFALQLAISALLFAFAPRPVWSLFINVLDLPLVALLFGAEFLVRRRLHPGRAHVGPIRIVSALRARASW